MRLGDVVVVSARLDERIRTAEGGLKKGTIIELTRDACWVLLTGGDIWTGKPRDVYLDQVGLKSEIVVFERDYEEVS